jgi:prepilin-type processing-associated H-X9-DG protein
MSISGAALAASLSSQAAISVPTGLAALITGVVIVAPVNTALSLTTLIAMTKLKIAVALIIAALAVTTLYQVRLNTTLREENRALREQVIVNQQLDAENDRLTKAVDTARDPSTAASTRELIRLRGQISTLRRQLADSRTRPNTKSDSQPESWTDWADKPEGETAMGKMNYGKALAHSLILFSDKNRNQFSTNFDAAASFLPSSARAQTNFAADQFELLYQGRWDTLTNPMNWIVLREKEPWVTPHGQWARTYAFADGHSEVRIEPNGDFDEWELQHRPDSREP